MFGEFQKKKLITTGSGSRLSKWTLLRLWARIKKANKEDFSPGLYGGSIMLQSKLSKLQKGMDSVRRAARWTNRHNSRRKFVGLKVETRVLGEIAVVHLAGKLVFRDEAKALSEHVMELLDRRLSVVLNLEGVTAIDGGGLGVLVASSKRAENRGLALKICSLDPRVREVFAITNLNQVLGVHDHEEAALESFGVRAA